MPPPSPQALADALLHLPPRATQVLLAACRERPSVEALATHLGTTPEAAAVVLLEALEHLDQALGGTPGPAGWPEVQTRAAALTHDLRAPTPATPLAQLAGALAQAMPEVTQLLDRARAAEDASPRRAAETWLRRAAIVALLAATAWFYAHRA